MLMNNQADRVFLAERVSFNLSKNFYYGGQAVIEGVMMRGRTSMAIAVRKPSGGIQVKEDEVGSITRRFPILKWPLIRGVVALIEALVIGMNALSYSASIFTEEEEEQLGAKEIALTIVVAILLSVGLFIALPAFVIRLVQAYISSDILLNLTEGLIKITFFLGYVVIISFMPDIRRVFEYHGAEHKSINCYEAGKELTVENIRSHSRLHRRCGTSFIVIVLIVSILVFSFFGRPQYLQRVLLHLALMPLVAGIAYEFIRLAGRKDAPRLFAVLSLPGVWTQYITTREPDDQQIEVAIRSLGAVLAHDQDSMPAVP